MPECILIIVKKICSNNEGIRFQSVSEFQINLADSTNHFELGNGSDALNANICSTRSFVGRNEAIINCLCVVDSAECVIVCTNRLATPLGPPSGWHVTSYPPRAVGGQWLNWLCPTAIVCSRLM